MRVVSDLGAVFFSDFGKLLPSSLPSFHTSFHAHASFLPTLPFFPRFHLPSFLFDPSISLPACCSLNHLALHLPHISPAYLVTLRPPLPLPPFPPPPSSLLLMASTCTTLPRYLLHSHNRTHSAKTYLIIPHLDITISALRNESVALARSRGKSKFRAVAITAQMMNGVSTIRFTPCKSPAS